jgi:hypothetical protein
LAQTGEGIAECELLKWYVQEVSVVLIWILMYAIFNEILLFMIMNGLLCHIGRVIMLRIFNHCVKFKVIKLL